MKGLNPSIMARLMAGNERFVRQKAKQAISYSRETLEELAQGQKPICAILACADSRTVPELIFDQPLGSLFVIRIAGNIATPEAVASLEFAYTQLGVSNCLVVGHTRCGAIETSAKIQTKSDLENLSPPLRDLVLKVKENTDSRSSIDHQIWQNMTRSCEQILEMSKVLQKANARSEFGLDGVVYSLHDGKILENFIDEGSREVV